jgi:hypothetical protein
LGQVKTGAEKINPVFRLNTRLMPGLDDLVEANWDMRWNPELAEGGGSLIIRLIRRLILPFKLILRLILRKIQATDRAIAIFGGALKRL